MRQLDDFKELMEKVQSEDEERLNSLPIPLKYTGDSCERCNRVRVELYDNGHLICEKCNWNHVTKEYNDNKFY